KSNLNVCRLAKDKLTITNVDTGGEITTYEEIYPDLFIQGGKVPDRDELEEAAASLASYIEEEFGPHGEIGMDIAIDIHGGIWFIEANARPGKFISPKMVDVFGKPWMKSLNSRNKGDESILPMAASVFKYARFLFEKGTS
ncbi:MAG: YheC/YheD family protein, partial [Bacillota bacterium]|nr:YheC/YheD family protein [Bacillota bacterium]